MCYYCIWAYSIVLASSLVITNLNTPTRLRCLESIAVHKILRSLLYSPCVLSFHNRITHSTIFKCNSLPPQKFCSIQYFAEHETGTEKYLDTCQCKIKFVLTFAKNDYALVEICTVVLYILTWTLVRSNWDLYRSTPKVLGKYKISDC